MFGTDLLLPLQDAKIEPEEFTNRLQSELKSSPQPYLVPFLKVGVPTTCQGRSALSPCDEGLPGERRLLRPLGGPGDRRAGRLCVAACVSSPWR